MPTFNEVLRATSDFKEACAVRKSIIALNLSRSARFDTLTEKEFSAIYNGYGPDDWPLKIRAAITYIYDNWQELAGVHDEDFDASDGTQRGWLEATARWGINIVLMLDARYPLKKVWLWPARSLAWAKLRLAYRALQIGSWGSWVDAHNRSTKL